MTATQGPAGVPYTFPVFGSPTGLPADAPVLSPNEFGAPTLVLGGTQAAAVWRFEAPEAGRYRIDGELTIRLAKTPLPFNHAFATYYYVYQEGVGVLVARSTDLDTEEVIGEVFNYDPGSTFWIIIWPQEYDVDTSDSFPTPSWAVPRISGPGVEETVQLSDRDCIVTWSDSTVVPPADGDFIIGPTSVGYDWYIGSPRFLDGIFWGSWTITEPFNMPGGVVGAMDGIFERLWSVARARELGGPFWWTPDYDGNSEEEVWLGPPTGDPDVGPGPAPGRTYPDLIPLCGWDIVWNGPDLLPTTASTRVFGASFSLQHSRLLSFAGKLGDGVQDREYDTEEEREAHLLQYLTTEDMILEDITFNATTSTMLGLQFQPDEKATSWNPLALRDVQVAWLTSMPTEDIPTWGTYLDLGLLYNSTQGKPEDWLDPTLSTITVIGPGGGGGWIDIDFASRQAYQDDLDVAYPGGDVPAYRFYCFPYAMWDPDGLEGAQDPAGGEKDHYNGDPRFALKIHVRPAPFTAHWAPRVEPADPDYPELVADPGPNRAAFWPQ